MPASEPPRAGAIMHVNCSSCMTGTTPQKEQHLDHLGDGKCTTTNIGIVHLGNTGYSAVSAIILHR